MPVHCDLKVLLAEMNKQTVFAPAADHSHWLAWCRERVQKYPVVQDKQRNSGPPLNPYHFVELLEKCLEDDDAVVCANATACIVPFQALHLRGHQRLFSNSGSASMGYDLPAAIGACVAKNGRVICLAGDGSIQMNIQELQTIVNYQLPVKIFVLNNDGYLSMRLTQSNFFGRLVGESKTSGVSFPDMEKIGSAYGISTMHFNRADQVDKVRDVLKKPGPMIINVALDPTQGFEPRLKSKQLEDGTIVTPALDDMFPFLPAEELEANRYSK
jgi:acetolactate synthase I/II/III large subunit